MDRVILMKTIQISNNLYGELWKLATETDVTEEDILRRILKASPASNAWRDIVSLAGTPLPPPLGYTDKRFDLYFPEGFKISRDYKGKTYVAVAKGGAWQLDSDNQRYGSLNQLNKGVGAETENAWSTWWFKDTKGEWKLISELRDEEKVIRRK